jgi:hypothetical protein
VRRTVGEETKVEVKPRDMDYGGVESARDARNVEYGSQLNPANMR